MKRHVKVLRMMTPQERELYRKYTLYSLEFPNDYMTSFAVEMAWLIYSTASRRFDALPWYRRIFK